MILLKEVEEFMEPMSWRWQTLSLPWFVCIQQFWGDPWGFGVLSTTIPVTLSTLYHHGKEKYFSTISNWEMLSAVFMQITADLVSFIRTRSVYLGILPLAINEGTEDVFNFQLTSSLKCYTSNSNWLFFLNFLDMNSAVLSLFFTSLYVKGKGIPLQHIKLTKSNNFACGKADVWIGHW